MPETVNIGSWTMSVDILTAVGTLVLIVIGIATYSLTRRFSKNAEAAEFRKETRDAVAEMKAGNDAFRAETLGFVQRIEGSVERLAKRVSAVEIDQARTGSGFNVILRGGPQRPPEQNGEEDADS